MTAPGWEPGATTTELADLASDQGSASSPLPRDLTQPRTIGGNAYAYPMLVAAGTMPRVSTDAAGPWTGPGADLTIGQRQAVVTARLVDNGTLRADSVDADTLARGRALIIDGGGQW